MDITYNLFFYHIDLYLYKKRQIFIRRISGSWYMNAFNVYEYKENLRKQAKMIKQIKDAGTEKKRQHTKKITIQLDEINQKVLAKEGWLNERQVHGTCYEFEEMWNKTGSDSNCNWCSWSILQMINSGTGGFGNKKTSRDHPNYSTVDIGQNSEKYLGDLKWLAIAQTPVRNRRLTLVRKTLKRVIMSIIVIIIIITKAFWQHRFLRLTLSRSVSINNFTWLLLCMAFIVQK